MADLTFTTIEEPARKVLAISRDEYALCNYIQVWSAHPANKQPGYCDRTKGQMAEFIGITTRGIMKMLDRMERVELIERFSEKRFLHRITARWFDTVSMAKSDRKGEQSSPLKENKVLPKGEQSSPLKENKVLPKGEQSSPQEENKVPPHKDTNKDSKELDKEVDAGEALLSPPFTKVTVIDPDTPGFKIVDIQSIEAEKEKSPPVAAHPPAKKKASKTQEEAELAGRVIEYLNKQAGRNFRVNAADNAKGIISQARQGFTEAQMCKVIDFKIRQWSNDDKMREHLNPVTLFRPSNFERYLNAATLPPMSQGPQNPGRGATIVRSGGDMGKYEEKQVF